MSDELVHVLRAGIKAHDIKYSGKYNELASLSFFVLTDLALQNFKCIRSGECVLLINKPFYIVYWNEDYRPSIYKYSCILKERWNEEGNKAVEIVKSVEALGG